MLFKNLSKILMVLFFASAVVSCGDDDAGPASQGQSAAPAATSSAPAATSSAPETMEEDSMMETDPGMDIGMDNGVIYKDEIYKNWPYQ